MINVHHPWVFVSTSSRHMCDCCCLHCCAVLLCWLALLTSIPYSLQIPKADILAEAQKKGAISDWFPFTKGDCHTCNKVLQWV